MPKHSTSPESINAHTACVPTDTRRTPLSSPGTSVGPILYPLPSAPLKVSPQHLSGPWLTVAHAPSSPWLMLAASGRHAPSRQLLRHWLSVDGNWQAPALHRPVPKRRTVCASTHSGCGVTHGAHVGAPASPPAPPVSPAASPLCPAFPVLPALLPPCPAAPGEPACPALGVRSRLPPTPGEAWPSERVPGRSPERPPHPETRAQIA